MINIWTELVYSSSVRTQNLSPTAHIFSAKANDFHDNSTFSAWISLPQIESETSNNEKDLNVAIVHLETLGREINALKTKCANNSMAAVRAEETATMARDKANEAKQVWVSPEVICLMHLRQQCFQGVCCVFLLRFLMGSWQISTMRSNSALVLRPKPSWMLRRGQRVSETRPPSCSEMPRGSCTC